MFLGLQTGHLDFNDTCCVMPLTAVFPSCFATPLEMQNQVMKHLPLFFGGSQTFKTRPPCTIACGVWN